MIFVGIVETVVGLNFIETLGVGNVDILLQLMQLFTLYNRFILIILRKRMILVEFPLGCPIEVIIVILQTYGYGLQKGQFFHLLFDLSTLIFYIEFEGFSKNPRGRGSLDHVGLQGGHAVG